MTIETKYNIGQEVYVIYEYYDTGKQKAQWKIEEYPHEIRNIKTKTSCIKGNLKTYISYRLRLIGWFVEENVFDTYEKAKEEVDRRNNT